VKAMGRWKTNDIIRARLKKDEAELKMDESRSCGIRANKADIERVRAQLKKLGLENYVVETAMLDGSVAVRYVKNTPDSVKVTVGRVFR